MICRTGRWRRAIACSPAHTPANSLVDRFMDNSNRRQYGMGVVGRMTRYIDTKSSFCHFFFLFNFQINACFVAFFSSSAVYLLFFFNLDGLMEFVNSNVGCHGMFLEDISQFQSFFLWERGHRLGLLRVLWFYEAP